MTTLTRISGPAGRQHAMATFQDPATLAGVQPGDVVAVWGAGGVGQMAARASVLLGAEKVMVIDRIPERLSMAEQYAGAETIDYSTTDVGAELRERTGGRVRTSASRRSA